MASALSTACAVGDLDAVRDILNASAPVDLEQKDQFGVTALIEAVRNGHVEIVTALVERGADPTHGLPESYTSDAAVLNALRRPTQEASGSEDVQYSAPYAFYPPPADGAPFYPPPNGPDRASPGGIGHLPPPDVARFIPCRYFPACRYGASCMFAHPQQFYPQPTYDHINLHHFQQNYFPPPPFQSPPPHPAHGPSPSDIPIPPVQPPFSPNGLPPAPYGPLSPNAYPHPGQTPVPMMMSPLPPPHHQQQPPNPMYTNPPSAVPPFIPHDPSAPYPVPLPAKPDMPPHEFNADVKPLDAPGPNNHHPIRDGSGPRRGGPRRPSFNTSARKPPCLFFPSGRCKNGDDCRYPHVIPEPNAPHHAPFFSGNRGSRPPRQPNGNSVAHINEKLAGMNVRDDAPAARNAADAPNNRSESNGRPRFNHGGKNGYNHQNGARPDKRPPPSKQQRVPNADEFPVLAGSITPPARPTGGLSNGNGPTAAQILSAPAPFRPKESTSKDPSTRGTSPDPAVKSAAPKAEPNGVAPETAAPATTTTHDHSPATTVKLPISFAAVTAAPSELPREIALSA